MCNAPARVLSHSPPLSSPPATLSWSPELPGCLVLEETSRQKFEMRIWGVFSPLSAFRGPPLSLNPPEEGRDYKEGRCVSLELLASFT